MIIVKNVSTTIVNIIAIVFVKLESCACLMDEFCLSYSTYFSNAKFETVPVDSTAPG